MTTASRLHVRLSLCVVLVLPFAASAAAHACNAGVVYEDLNGNGTRDAGDPGLAGVRVSDGKRLVTTDTTGAWRLPAETGRTTFVIKPAGFDLPTGADGLPVFWRHLQPVAGPALKYGGLPPTDIGCHDFALIRRKVGQGGDLQVLLFGDPQAKSMQDVGYYARDIVEPLLLNDAPGKGLGLSLGDIVNDDLTLYPAMKAVTAKLRTPWLHVPGNHDLDFDAARDEDSLQTFRREFGPDTLAWEESQAVFVTLDDIIYRPGERPAYVGGLREDQFEFLQAYLPTVPRDRLLVVAAHIPFFDAAATGQPPTFRPADRERLFALLRDFPRVLLLSAHTHNQRHYFHGAAEGWHGAQPLHEYNVGAACGAFWSGVKDAAGIPDSRMSDGTPNGYATMTVGEGGNYALAWYPARDAADTQLSVHAPKVLRRGAYPAWGVYANVFMGHEGKRVEYRVDEGEWKPMQRVVQPDPDLLGENQRDDEALQLRGYDRSPEATPSQHLWRGALPTNLGAGAHRVQVRAFGVRPDREFDVAELSYELAEARP
jgi:hypothetical protein